MKKLCLAVLLGTSLLISAQAQDAKNFLGRWDLTLTGPQGTYPDWLELVEKDGKLDGRFQPRGGAVRPIVGAKVEGSHLLVTVAAATERAPETVWDLTASG